MPRSSLIALVTLALCACASTGTQVLESQLAQFQKGVTTQADVERQLGAPQSNTLESDGTRSIAYVYTRAQAKGATFIPIVGLFAGGATGNTNVVTFKFGTDGKLLEYSATSSNADVRTGIVNGTSTK